MRWIVTACCISACRCQRRRHGGDAEVFDKASILSREIALLQSGSGDFYEAFWRRGAGPNRATGIDGNTSLG